MLAKLLKHEFRATGKLLPVSYLAALALFVTATLAKLIFGMNSFVFVLPTVFFVFSLFFVMIYTYIVIILRYYKGLFGDEGYLTQTLPVKKSTILLSRYITAFVWLFAACALMCVGVMALMSILNVPLEDMFSVVGGVFKTAPHYVAFAIISVLIGGALFLCEVYFSISLAHTSKFIKNNVIFSVVFYFILNVTTSVLDALAMMFIPLSIVTDGATGATSLTFSTSMFGNLIDAASSTSGSVVGMPSLGVGNIIVDALLIAALVVLTNYLLGRKVSVK